MLRAVSIALLAFALAPACGGGDEQPAPPVGELVVSADDDLEVVGADGSGRRTVVAAPGPQFDADWSPEGLLVYRDSRSGVNVDDEIYIIGADGSGERNLTRDPANDWSPAWSPDGSQIAFASDREGELRIFVMDADGSGVRRVTEIWGEYPAWSPDGESIAFHSTRSTPEDFEPPSYDLERTADYDVFVVPAEGGEAVNVTQDLSRPQRFPDWSPDGAWLAVDEEGIVVFAAADGSGMRRSDGLTGGFPAWAPAGQAG